MPNALGYPSGRVQIKVRTAARTAACIASRAARTSRAKDNVNTAAIETVAAILPRREIAPRSRHAKIGGPKTGCCNSQSCNCGDDRAKQNAARSMNGTVGKSGKNTPSAPKQSARIPQNAQTSRSIQSGARSAETRSSKRRPCAVGHNLSSLRSTRPNSAKGTDRESSPSRSPPRAA
mgnify:FL=1